MKRTTRASKISDAKSIEQFSAMRSALANEVKPTPSRLSRLGAGIVYVADTIRYTLQAGTDADPSTLELAQAHLEQGYSTDEDIQALREAGQPVQIKMPWQQ